MGRGPLAAVLKPCHCLCRRYEALRPHLVRAGQLVPEEQAERRVLMLINPTMGEELPDLRSKLIIF